MTLEQLLTLAVDGGLGILTYWLLEHPLANWYSQFRDDVKRWIAAGITAGWAVLAWGAGVGMGYWPAPAGDARSWIETVFGIVAGVATTFLTSQLSHTKAQKSEAIAEERANRVQLRPRKG